MMANHARADRATGARPTRSAVVRILLLVAFLVQSTLVQTHVHAAPLAAPAGISAQNATGQSGGPSQHTPADTSGYCFVCWEAAVAGQFLQPTAVFLPPPPQPAGWEAPQFAAEFALGKVSHGWLSRAPPQ